MLREALKISSPLGLLLREVPRFHGRSLWHCTPDLFGENQLYTAGSYHASMTSYANDVITPLESYK